MDELVLVVSPEDARSYRRLDLYLSDKIEMLSRSGVKDLFLKGLIQSNNCKLELKKMATAGVTIIVSIPGKAPCDASPENIPLEILFQDEHLVIVNKPAGMVTHPAPGNYTGTLVNAILYHCPDIKGVGDQKRPGIVHRLDKGTSGVMVIAKTEKCHKGLVKLFASHNIDRIYEALVLGTKMELSGTIKTMINRHRTHRQKMTSKTEIGKEAVTHYKVLGFYQNMTYVQLKLETGRTHQIRVHMCEVLNRPIICDPLYGNPKNHIKSMGDDYSLILKNYPHPFLYAKVLGFIHPITQEKMYFEVDPPEIFREVFKVAENE